jgi:hypothetical protein
VIPTVKPYQEPQTGTADSDATREDQKQPTG